MVVKQIVFSFLYLENQYTKAENVPIDKTFVEMGADSLDCMEITM